MDFDHSFDKITPDITSQLTIGGNGALVLPSGTTTARPSGASVGGLRWNTDTAGLEVYSGSAWVAPTTGYNIVNQLISGQGISLTYTGSTSGTGNVTVKLSTMITVSNTAPTSPAVGDIWINTT